MEKPEILDDLGEYMAYIWGITDWFFNLFGDWLMSFNFFKLWIYYFI